MIIQEIEVSEKVATQLLKENKSVRAAIQNYNHGNK